MARRRAARGRLALVGVAALLAACLLSAAAQEFEQDDDASIDEGLMPPVDADAAGAAAPPSRQWQPPPPLPCTREPALRASADLPRGGPSAPPPTGSLAAGAMRLVGLGALVDGVGGGGSGGGGGLGLGSGSSGEVGDVWRCPAAARWWDRALAVWSPVTVTVSCGGSGSKVSGRRSACGL
jgi:hypothetical protein